MIKSFEKNQNLLIQLYNKNSYKPNLPIINCIIINVSKEFEC